MTKPTDELFVQDVTRQYDPPNGPVVLQGVSLHAQPGEAVAIVGPSGSGKSTLLNLIGSLDRPTTGTVRLGATQVDTLEGDTLAEYRARRVGFIFQDHHLLPQLTAGENVLLPSLAVSGGQKVAATRARELLDQVGLLDWADSFPAKLSGGQRQRVAVARALINNPVLLLGDEPTGNLDRETGWQVAKLLLDVARQRGAIVLVVTHNLELCPLFDRVLELREGKIKETTEEKAEIG